MWPFLTDGIFETGAYGVPSKSQNPTVLGQGGPSNTECSNPSQMNGANGAACPASVWTLGTGWTFLIQNGWDLWFTWYAPVSKMLSVKGTLIAERVAFMNQI